MFQLIQSFAPYAILIGVSAAIGYSRGYDVGFEDALNVIRRKP